jgi:hypothetical protein
MTVVQPGWLALQQGAADAPAPARARRLAAEVQAWHQARMEREPVRYFESEQLAALALVRAPAPAGARPGARGGRRRMRACTCPHCNIHLSGLSTSCTSECATEISAQSGVRTPSAVSVPTPSS